jgi:hypothetical protein
MMNRGVNYRYPIETPPVFKHYKFGTNVLRKATEEFNKKLDHRRHVTMCINTIKADVLRVVPTSDDTLAIWLVVKEKDIDTVHKMCFTITGDVYFEGDSEVNVDHMTIHDVMFGEDRGILTDKQRRSKI